MTRLISSRASYRRTHLISPFSNHCSCPMGSKLHHADYLSKAIQTPTFGMRVSHLHTCIFNNYVRINLDTGARDAYQDRPP